MKSITPYIVIFIIGIAAGMCLCRSFFPKEKVEIQKDTVVTYKTRYYSKLELQEQTARLDVPKVGTREYVFINDTTTIYKENVKYIVAPREYYHTSLDDAEIWHSGIDSRIDSLSIRQKFTEVTSVARKVEHRNYLRLGIEAGYFNEFCAPVYLQYERMILKNVAVNAKGFYDIPSGKAGFFIGTSIGFGW